MSFEETTSAEIEALEYTYGTSFRVLSTDPLHVSVVVEPFTGEDNTRMYVRAELIVFVGKKYPDEVPEIELRNAKGDILMAPSQAKSDRLKLQIALLELALKNHFLIAGLGDMRVKELLSRLRQEAEESVGNMVLGLLIETARDVLTGMNNPEGDCIFCMNSLSDQASTSGSGELMKLPCYHCFHLYDLLPDTLPCRAQIVHTLSLTTYRVAHAGTALQDGGDGSSVLCTPSASTLLRSSALQQVPSCTAQA